MGGGAGAGSFFSGLLGGVGQGLAVRRERQDRIKRTAFEGALKQINDLANDPAFSRDPEAIQDLSNASLSVIADYAGKGEVTGRGKPSLLHPKGKTERMDPLTDARQQIQHILAKTYMQTGTVGDPDAPDKPVPHKGPVLSPGEAAERDARVQAKITAARAKQQNIIDTDKYQEAFKRNLATYPNDPVKAKEIAEEEVYNKNRSVEPKVTQGKSTKQFVQLPDGTTHAAWITPGLPGGILVDTGESLPQGWTPAAPPSGADARTTYAQLLRSLHDEHPELDKDQLSRMAGEEYQRKYGLEIGKAEQQIAINEVLSGVDGGAYKPPVPKAADTSGAKPRLTPKAAGSASTSTLLSPKENTDRSVYMADLLSNQKATGPERVRVINGRESFRKSTGLDPVAFEALAASDRGTAKAFIDTIERQASVERVNEVLKTFGDEAVKRAREIAKNEPDSPILKKPIRELTAATIGNPALARFLLAFNGFQRQYSTLTAGAGGLSRAQLPVGIADKVDHILDPNATLETVIQAVDQVKIEGNKEMEGFDAARRQMADSIKDSVKPGGMDGRMDGGKDKTGSTQPKTADELLKSLGKGQ